MRKIAVVFSFLLLAVACRTPFDPEVLEQPQAALVVEGYLDTEGLASELILSRTWTRFTEGALISGPWVLYVRNTLSVAPTSSTPRTPCDSYGQKVPQSLNQK
jgi:hypothetical protein